MKSLRITKRRLIPETNPRESSDSKRTKILGAEFTPEERTKVINHCVKNHISISNFLSQVALQAAELKRPQPAISVTYHISGEKPQTYPITSEQTAKLLLLARAQNKTVYEVMHKCITANLPSKAPLNVPYHELRFYLSDEEHQILMEHVKDVGISVRKYIAMLALDHIKNPSKHGALQNPIT